MSAKKIGTRTESKRVKAFRIEIVKAIPKFPNDRASLQALQAKSLGSLLIDYANWMIRYIAPRPRTVVVESTASSDPRWQLFEADIHILLERVRMGDDLTPHLSLQPHTRGFTPATSIQGVNIDRWADKDMLLNVMGYHHLHLDAAPTKERRSDEVIFAHVTRETFTVVGIFNHTVFKDTRPSMIMTPERERLWAIFDQRSSRGFTPGTMVMNTSITTSGHSTYFSYLAMRHARKVAEIDQKLDDRSYVLSLYEDAGVSVPAMPKVSWHLDFLTLGLLDKRAGFFFVLCKGPN